MALIEIKNVSYSYPTSHSPVVTDINLSFEEGNFYTLIGKNGSGKSTLCAMIRGFIPHFYGGILEGDVFFRGRSIREYSIGELSPQIGFVFQNPFNQMTGIRDTVFEEILYGLENFGIPPQEMQERADAVMELTEITHLKNAHPLALSGGQQQKVALASIIVLDPQVYVIDEPTSQLDPYGTEQVFQIIRKLKEQKKTIILVEHKVDLIVDYADEVIVLYDGTVIKQGEANSVLSDISLHQYDCLIPQTGLLMAALHSKNIPVGNSIKYNDIRFNLSKIIK